MQILLIVVVIIAKLIMGVVFWEYNQEVDRHSHHVLHLVMVKVGDVHQCPPFSSGGCNDMYSNQVISCTSIGGA